METKQDEVRLLTEILTTITMHLLAARLSKLWAEQSIASVVHKIKYK